MPPELQILHELALEVGLELQGTLPTQTLEPEVMERQVVIVQFDTNGVLQKVLVRGLEEGQMVIPVDRETPTLGNEPGFIQNFFGNLGKFNKE